MPIRHERKEVITLAAFRDAMLDWCRANRHKPSSVHGKASHLDQHLIPLFGDRPLDRFSPKDVERVKMRLNARSPKPVNNVFST